MLDRYQSGFRKNHSTQTALLKLTEDIRHSMDNNKLTLLVLFDLSKAFDYVDPKTILIALFELGFSLEVVAWFFSYLSNRSQSITSDQGIPINLLTTSSGVPQGSVLGPILFLIVINSVARRIIFCKYGLFADDVYIYLHFFNYQIHGAIGQVAADAQEIANRAREHGLELNLTKTKAMVLGSSSELRKLDYIEIPPIVVDGVAIPYVNSAKCLGLNLNHNLSWNNHVSLICKKINSSLHSLKVRKNIFTEEIRKLLVSATILPLIDYCRLVLIDCTSENNLKLQRAINSSIRFIFNLRKDEHITPHRRNLGWLSVKCCRLYYMVCFFFKLLNEGQPMYLRDLFIEDTDVRRSERLSAKKTYLLQTTKLFNNLFREIFSGFCHKDVGRAS